MFINIFHKILDHFLKNIVYLFSFYVVLTPCIDGDFIAYVSLLKLYRKKGQGSHLPLLLACFQNMVLTWYRKNQRRGNVTAIFQDFHDVMYMSINHGKKNYDFKTRGKVAMKEKFHKHKL
jgi:hypothetical protein